MVKEASFLEKKILKIRHESASFARKVISKNDVRFGYHLVAIPHLRNELH